MDQKTQFPEHEAVKLPLGDQEESLLRYEEVEDDLTVDPNSGEGHAEFLIEMSRYIGPLPHPDMLAAYEEIVPGSGANIIANMLDESKHRRSMEEQTLIRADRRSLLGQCFGLSIAIIGMAAAFLIFWFAKDINAIAATIAGSVLGGASLIPLVGKFTDRQREYKKPKKDVTRQDEQ
jgi:uncharacterized membrane protein